MSMNLRRHWKLVVLSIVLTVTTLVSVGDWRVSAVSGGSGSVATATYDIRNDVDLMDDSVVHTIEIVYDAGDFEAMRILFEEDGTKEWIRADITVDDVTIEDIGIRLKGNSTLFSLSGKGPGGAEVPPGVRGLPGGGVGIAHLELSWDSPEELPFLVSFDEYVADRTYQGRREVAIRIGGGTTPRTDLAEALGYAAVAAADAPAVDGAYAMVNVNGSEWVLHYVVETISDSFATKWFPGDGVLYKALSTGDFDFLGEDPTLYVDAFDQITGVNIQDLAPVIRLLDFINNASDEEFAAHLHEYVDVESFATYVALQSLTMNGDDIAGLGNNAYLWYDLETDLFTIITWDLNLAFAGSHRQDPTESSLAMGPGGAGAWPGPPAGFVGPGGGPPEWLPAPGGAPAGGRGGNVLKERFLAEPTFADMYQAAYQEAYYAVYESGLVHDELARLADMITTANDELGVVDEVSLEDEIAALGGVAERRAKWLAGNDVLVTSLDS